MDALVITHRHLDHAGDATAVVEAMTRGGFSRAGALLAPRDALEEEPVVFRYAQRVRGAPPGARRGEPARARARRVLETPLAHDHGVETYGYRLSAPGFTAGHVVDTYWMDSFRRRTPASTCCS